MNPDLFTPSNIMFVIGMLGIIFAIFNYFRNPQIDEEKRASLLAQQVQWEREATRARFEEMTKMIAATTTLAQNHIHTVDVKLDIVKTQIVEMTNNITRITTLLEERLPKRMI